MHQYRNIIVLQWQSIGMVMSSMIQIRSFIMKYSSSCVITLILILQETLNKQDQNYLKSLEYYKSMYRAYFMNNIIDVNVNHLSITDDCKNYDSQSDHYCDRYDNINEDSDAFIDEGLFVGKRSGIKLSSPYKIHQKQSLRTAAIINPSVHEYQVNTSLNAAHNYILMDDDLPQCNIVNDDSYADTDTNSDLYDDSSKNPDSFTGVTSKNNFNMIEEDVDDLDYLYVKDFEYNDVYQDKSSTFNSFDIVSPERMLQMGEVSLLLANHCSANAVTRFLYIIRRFIDSLYGTTCRVFVDTVQF